MISRRVAALILALGCMSWGAWVDSKGLPVTDQVLGAVVLSVIALVSKEESK